MKRNLFAGKRQSGGLGLNLFTHDELEEIHMATLEVLEKTGLLFDDDEALEVLDGGGAVSISARDAGQQSDESDDGSDRQGPHSVLPRWRDDIAQKQPEQYGNHATQRLIG